MTTVHITELSTLVIISNVPEASVVQVIGYIPVSVIDHGDFAGLADDDHAQYILVAGTRAFSGDQAMGTHKFTGLSVPVNAGDSIRATVKITEVLLESATDLKHTQGTDTGLGALAADINMNTHQLTSLSAPDANGEAIRVTTKITEVNLESAVDLKHAAVTIGADSEHSLVGQVLSGADAAAAQKGHIQLAGELTGTAAAPTITASHSGSVHVTLAIDPLWDAMGDTVYGTGVNTGGKLTGNITTTRKFLRQLGTGAVSAAPDWDTIADADVPTTHSGSAHHSAISLATSADVLLGLSTQTLSLDVQTMNLIFAGPIAGDPAAPTFRAMVNADLPVTLSPTFVGLNLSGLTISLPVVTDGSKNLASLAYTGATSFRANLGLEPTNAPTFDDLNLYDTNASHVLTLHWNENEATASRTLNLVMGGADRTITLSGNPTLNDWFDQAVKAASSPTFARISIAGGTGATLGLDISPTGWETKEHFHVPFSGNVLVISNNIVLTDFTTGNLDDVSNAGSAFVFGASGQMYLATVAAGANPRTVVTRFFVNYNGNVGIGDQDPGELLDVAGNINATGVLKIDDVQVVSNRVVDARIDDAINESAWDSTTAGVLDAIRDAMLTHGLMAAAS